MNGTQRDTLNEDWIKLIGWDVTDAAGQPVTTLDALAKVLDTDRAGAARELMGSPASATAPDELVEEAEAELAPVGQVSLLDEWADENGDTPNAAPAEPAARAEEAAEEETGATEEDDEDDEDEDEDEDEDVEGKAFPWQKGGGKKGPDTGDGTRKATIAAGAFVSGNFGKGKVEVVVTTGKVPGVDTDVEGTKATPAARVRVYEETDGKWKATDKRVAVKVSSLKTIPPLGAAKFGKKSAEPGSAGLVLLVAQLDPEHDVPAEKVRVAFERGKSAWPGETRTTLSRDEWGLGRAHALVEKARGNDVPGYVGDDDLLP